MPYSLCTCHMAVAGCAPYRSAGAVTMRREAARYAGALTQYVSRLPWASRTPSARTGIASG